MRVYKNARMNLKIIYMPRGGQRKISNMNQVHDNTKLPAAQQGDKIIISLEITRVSNGFIVKNIEPGTKAGVMVFNGANAHQLATGHVLNLALIDMKEGEVINFSSQMEFSVKK